jgi:glycosyltransferase involved in cell wall biosynthesis
LRNHSKDYRHQVVQLSTSTIGGAGIAARRLNQSLNEHGFESIFVSLRKKTEKVSTSEYLIVRSFLRRFVSVILSRIQAQVSTKVFFSVVSLSAVKWRVLSRFIVDTHTIIHIHNAYNLLGPKLLREFEKIENPVVITAHDQRLMTGGCHYSLDCKEFHRECGHCPELPTILNKITHFSLNELKASLGKSKNRITVIAPSKWMYRELLESYIAKSCNIVYIPNVPEQKDFAEFDEKPIRNHFGSKLIVGIASLDPSAYIKGGDIVRKLISKSDDYFEFLLLKDVTTREESDSKFWEKIDVLLVPSRADNSPNVIHEAKSRGIPIIASAVGGIPELLHPDFDVAIPTEKLSDLTIIEELKKFSRRVNTPQRKAIRQHWFGVIQDPVAAHIELYQSLMPKTSKEL